MKRDHMEYLAANKSEVELKRVQCQKIGGRERLCRHILDSKYPEFLAKERMRLRRAGASTCSRPPTGYIDGSGHNVGQNEVDGQPGRYWGDSIRRPSPRATIMSVICRTDVCFKGIVPKTSGNLKQCNYREQSRFAPQPRQPVDIHGGELTLLSWHWFKSVAGTWGASRIGGARGLTASRIGERHLVASAMMRASFVTVRQRG